MGIINRECNKCCECCVYAGVEGNNFYKPPHSVCPYLKEANNHRCIIYNSKERPIHCNSFLCAWMRGFGEENDRPDKSGIILSTNSFNNGKWIFAIEMKENALTTTGKSIVLCVSDHIDLPVVVVAYGSKPPNDFGDYTVIKESLKHRAGAMMGKFITYLDEENQFGLYELVVK